MCLSRLDLSNQSISPQVMPQQQATPHNIEEFKQFIRGVVIPNLNTHGANSP